MENNVPGRKKSSNKADKYYDKDHVLLKNKKICFHDRLGFLETSNKIELVLNWYSYPIFQLVCYI